MDAPHADSRTGDDTRLGSPLPAEAGPVPATIPAAPAMRIGRAEREEAQARLRQALADDVLSINEFDARLGAVLGARTQTELDEVLADLPDQPAAPSHAGTSRSRARRWILAMLGGTEQRGRWRPDKPVVAGAFLGGAVVDLRDAETEDGEFVVEAVAFMGGIDVIVPDDSEVDLGGFAFMGARDNKVPAPTTQNGPLVRVNGYAFMGGVVVRTAKKKERQRFPVSDEGSRRQWQRPPGPPKPAKPSMVGRVLGGVLAAALILGPGQAIVTADERVLFSGDTVEPTEAQLRGEEDLDIFVMFGGMEVVVPDGTSVDDEVTSVFGGDDCGAACEAGRGADLRVDGFVGFGGASILTESEFRTEQQEDSDSGSGSDAD